MQYGVTSQDESTESTLALAVIGSSVAVVLVAIAIILIICLFICRGRKRFQQDVDPDWSKRAPGVAVGEAVGEVPQGHYGQNVLSEVRILQPDDRSANNSELPINPIGSMPISDDLKPQRQRRRTNA